MMAETAFQLNQYISSLQEPQRFIAFMLVYAGLPILCILLWALNDTIENRKREKKEFEEKCQD